MVALAQDLWINSWKKVILEGEKYTADVKASVIQFKHAEKNKLVIVENIAQLLQLNPSFSDKDIQEKVFETQEKDLLLKCQRMSADEIKNNFNNEMIGPDKTYQIAWGNIRYSFGWDKTDELVRPSANFITEDALHFQPIDKQLSMDSTSIYWQYYKVAARVKDKLPERFWKTKYRIYNGNLFSWNTYVSNTSASPIQLDSFADVESLYTDVIRINWTHPKIITWQREAHVVKRPRKLEHSVDNFFFDGENIYMLYWELYNITDMYKLPPYQNIELLSKEGKWGVYNIGLSKMQLEYDGGMGLKVIK